MGGGGFTIAPQAWVTSVVVWGNFPTIHSDLVVAWAIAQAYRHDVLENKSQSFRQYFA